MGRLWSGADLQVTVAHGFLVQSLKLGGALLGHVHQIACDGARSGVDWSLPEKDQGVASDLAEAQVVGWTCTSDRRRR